MAPVASAPAVLQQRQRPQRLAQQLEDDDSGEEAEVEVEAEAEAEGRVRGVAEQAIVPCADTTAASVEAIVGAILHGNAPQLHACAQAWGALASRDIPQALLIAIAAGLELAGLPNLLQEADLRAAPETFLSTIPGMVKDRDLDARIYPLLPSAKDGRRTVSFFSTFWTEAVSGQSPEVVLRILPGILRWLLVMARAGLRAVRHTATIAALAIAEALGRALTDLHGTREALAHQLKVAQRCGDSSSAQLTSMLRTAEDQRERLLAHRTEVIGGIVPRRSRDICDDVRQHVLCEVEKQLKQDPEALFDTIWTDQVLRLMTDPTADVRLKALTTFSRCCKSFKKTAKRQKQLRELAEQCLPLLMDRTGDKDARVAVAAVRCLRMPLLVEVLSTEQFNEIADLAVGGRTPSLREEAALFVNSHVFGEPGICRRREQAKPNRGLKMLAAPLPPQHTNGVEAAADVAITKALAHPAEAAASSSAGIPDAAPAAEAPEAILTLLEYLEEYLDDKLRLAERIVDAFWVHAPVLTQWGQMLHVLTQGEEGGPLRAQAPLTAKQRLCLLYIMEAAVRRVASNVKLAGLADHEAAAAHAHMQEACRRILPHLPRLLEAARSEEAHGLLVSHMGKLLLDYAAEQKDKAALAEPPQLCQELRRAILTSESLAIVQNCTDMYIALAQFFDSVQADFLEVMRDVHQRCLTMLVRPAVEADSAELQSLMGRFVVLSSHGLDMTFGKEELMSSIRGLLVSRQEWLTRRKAAADQQPQEGGANSREPADLPAGTPGLRLTLQLICAASLMAVWHVKVAFWRELHGSQSNATVTGKSPQTQRAEDEVAGMLDGAGAKRSVRTGLVQEVRDLRQLLVRLLWCEEDPYVKFQAFSTYMMLLQLAMGVCDQISLEDGAPKSDGALYDVRVPEDHLKVLWLYLNGLYANATDEAEEVAFDADGCYFRTANVVPGVSAGSLTSTWHLLQRLIEGRDVGEAQDPNQHSMLFAVLASRAVLDSEAEDVYTGPLGQLLMTQCDRSRPQLLRELSTRFLRRLREMGKAAEELGELYFRMQAETIGSVYECHGIEAAQGICTVFTHHWGPQQLPILSKPLITVLKAAIGECVTKDGKRLPLLEAFAYWMKSDDFSPASVRRDLKKLMLERCEACGINPRSSLHVVSFMKRASARQLHAAAPPVLGQANQQGAEDHQEQQGPSGSPTQRRLFASPPPGGTADAAIASPQAGEAASTTRRKKRSSIETTPQPHSRQEHDQLQADSLQPAAMSSSNARSAKRRRLSRKSPATRSEA